MKNFEPKKNFVLIKFVKKEEEKKTKSGLYLPNQDDKSDTGVSPGKYDFVIEKIGPDAEVEAKVGDKVIFNEYDMKGLQDEDDTMYALVQDKSIMASYT